MNALEPKKLALLQYRTVKVIADGSRHYGYSAEEER